MKRFISLLILSCCVNAAFPQSQKYQRVLIHAPAAKKSDLLRMGVTVDHSHVTPGGIEADISSYELGILNSAGITYDVLIDDVSAYYAGRNSAGSNKPGASACNYPAVGTPTNFHLGTMGGYFTLQQMENILDSMALLYPNLISAKQPISATQSIEGRNIWYVKISDNPNLDENEPEVLYTSLHHAREGASLSQLIFYMWYLLENYNTDPDIRSTVDSRELYFVPCVNPDGYVFNETINPAGGGMWRKNRRPNSNGSYGVDLNRNYGQFWGYDLQGSSATPASDVYRGASAFSEPETQAMRDFCNSRQFRNALNAHTFGNDLIYPWGHLPSFYTPDNSTFESWGEYLTRDHRYIYGTCNETLNYLTNGGSDDWMYGEQTSKPKIFAMTPETGTFSDGFWPAASRIVDICKTTVTQNYRLARLAGNCLVAYDMQDKFLLPSGYIRFKVKRLGLSAGTSTVSVIAVGNGLSSSSIGAAKVYTGLTQNQEIMDSVGYSLQTGLTPGQTVQYVLCVNNDGACHYQLLNKIFGYPTVRFYDNGTSESANFDLTGTWGTYQTEFVSAPSCISESPAGPYQPNEHKTITTKGQIDLTGVLAAHLQFYTSFLIEKTFDKMAIEISTDGGQNFSPLCGQYETPPVTFDGTEPVYDGRQDNWVKEDIDLSAYIGQKVKIRLRFDSDPYDEREGFLFDDFLVRVVQPTISTVGVGQSGETTPPSVYPNPGNGQFLVNIGRPAKITVLSCLGESLMTAETTNPGQQQLDLSGFSPGIYFLRIEGAGCDKTLKILLEKDGN